VTFCHIPLINQYIKLNETNETKETKMRIEKIKERIKRHERLKKENINNDIIKETQKIKTSNANTKTLFDKITLPDGII